MSCNCNEDHQHDFDFNCVSNVLGDGSPVPPGDNPICTFLAVPNARLISTNTCLTVDLSCFCAIQCLRDVTI